MNVCILCWYFVIFFFIFYFLLFVTFTSVSYIVSCFMLFHCFLVNFFVIIFALPLFSSLELWNLLQLNIKGSIERPQTENSTDPAFTFVDCHLQSKNCWNANKEPNLYLTNASKIAKLVGKISIIYIFFTICVTVADTA